MARCKAMLAAAAASLVVALCLVQPTHAARVLHLLSRKAAEDMTLPCAQMGASPGSTFMNATATCLKLWPAPGAAIRLPGDTATLKWGQVFISDFGMGSDDATAVFIDREGKQYPINPSANPPTDPLQLQRIWPLLIVQATVAAGNVTAFSVELYVPFSTIMATMANTQFEGTLFNSAPRPAGIPELSWFRWTFGSVINVTDPTFKYGTLLEGTFDNLFQSVIDSNGVCRPALCADPTFQSATCQYYTQFFGNTTNAMTLNWDPNMHMPVDTELVPMFPATHRQYMSSFMELYQLLSPGWSFVPHKYVFIAHGTPMGIPQNFTGAFRPTDTPVKPCTAL